MALLFHKKRRVSIKNIYLVFCNSFLNTINLFGCTISFEGLKPDKSRSDAIQNFPAPSVFQELGRFLGMVAFIGGLYLISLILCVPKTFSGKKRQKRPSTKSKKNSSVVSHLIPSLWILHISACHGCIIGGHSSLPFVAKLLPILIVLYCSQQLTYKHTL